MSIILPKTYANIFNDAFRNCAALKSITLLAKPTNTINGLRLFDGCDALEAIYVPAADVEAFKAYSGLQPYADKIKANPNEVPAE